MEPTSPKPWTAGAPALSPTETDTVLARALGAELAAAEAAAHTRRAHEAKVLTARVVIRAIAMELAESGLSAETIQEAMLDMATDASSRAAAYIAEYDEAEERRIAIDREDIDDEREDRRRRVTEGP